MTQEQEQLILEIFSKLEREAVYLDDHKRMQCCHYCDGEVEYVDGGRFFIHSQQCLTRTIMKLQAMS